MTNHPAGWYPDPSGDVTMLRYWNGEQWTDDYTKVPFGENPGNAYAAPSYQQPISRPAYDDGDRTLRMVAFVFCILSLVSVCWLIIPLAWMIPMSVHCWGIYQGTKPNTVGFGICTLLFLSLVGGILLLVSKKDA